LEKVSLPRRKVCAGGVVKRAINLLPDDLDYPVESICDTIELRAHGIEKTFRSQSEGLVTMVSRTDFDYAIVQYAEKKGTQVLDQTEVKSVTPHDDYVEIITTDRSYRSSYLILAEGANARIANSFWKDDRVLLPALESEILLPPGKLAEYQGVAHFDFDVISSGYTWIFPKKDHVSVGIAGFANKKVLLNELFDSYKQQVGLTDEYEERNRKGYIIPIKPRQQPFMKNRMILVGDTAGFADPITAEGFTYALKSGIEAGKAIACGHSPEEVFQLYHEGIREAIVQELNVASKISKPFYLSKTVKNILFRRYGQRICNSMARVIEGKQSYYRALKKHSLLARWIMDAK